MDGLQEILNWIAGCIERREEGWTSDILTDIVNISIKKAINWTFSCVYISEKVVSIQLSVTE
jgi:hypothetical protein